MAKRGEKAERRENDHYVTPDWAIRRLLEKYSPQDVSRIIDPCAARGELIKTAAPFFPAAQWAACEINPDFEADLREVTGAVVIGDFLSNIQLFRSVGFDLVITNPPYNKALEFIQGALLIGRQETRRAPAVAMLLRINFLASQARREFLAGAKPGIFVLPNRPSFTGEGGDQTEYAWFVFGDPFVAGRIEFCDVTPTEQIKASNLRARRIHGGVEVAA